MHVSVVSRLLPTDPRYAPFGRLWLRGLNVQRIGFVLLAGLMLSTRSAVSGAFAGDLSGALAHLAASVPRNVMTWMPALIAVAAADGLTTGRRTIWRIPAFAAAAFAGGLCAAWLNGPVYCLVFGYPQRLVGQCGIEFGAFESGHLLLFTYGALYATLTYFLSRQHAIAASLHVAQLKRVDADRQLSEARWRSLRAQIEPHFLFNTLAHIRRLYQVAPAQGRQMLVNLTEYLHAALPDMRRSAETLGREMALVRAYLRLQQIRMGRRLEYTIDVPAELGDAVLPSMMVVTLVENAIKHGLGPKRGGGRIFIGASQSGPRLDLEVSDDGVGLSLGAGTGVGLANTRSRLATQFGAAARFEIFNRDQGGVTARLSLPLQWQVAPAVAA